jgi:CDP-glucose 4,6-dehydratase
MLTLMGSDLEPEIRNEATGEIRRQYLSAQKAREVLGWRPLRSLEEGLGRTIEWYRRLLVTPA